MIPRAQQAPRVTYTGEGRGYVDRRAARRRGTQAFANAAYEDEFARGGARAQRRLSAWLAGRTLSGSLEA